MIVEGRFYYYMLSLLGVDLVVEADWYSIDDVYDIVSMHIEELLPLLIDKSVTRLRVGPCFIVPRSIPIFEVGDVGLLRGAIIRPLSRDLLREVESRLSRLFPHLDPTSIGILVREGEFLGARLNSRPILYLDDEIRLETYENIVKLFSEVGLMYSWVPIPHCIGFPRPLPLIMFLVVDRECRLVAPCFLNIKSRILYYDVKGVDRLRHDLDKVERYLKFRIKPLMGSDLSIYFRDNGFIFNKVDNDHEDGRGLDTA